MTAAKRRALVAAGLAIGSLLPVAGGGLPRADRIVLTGTLLPGSVAEPMATVTVPADLRLVAVEVDAREIVIPVDARSVAVEAEA